MVAIRIRITISDGFPLYIWIKTIKVIYKTSIDVPISIVLLYKKRAVPMGQLFFCSLFAFRFSLIAIRFSLFADRCQCN